MQLEQEIDRIKNIVDSLSKDAEQAMRLRSVLMSVTGNSQVGRLFNNTYEVQGLNTVYLALREQLVLVVMRMHDTYMPREGGKREKGGNRASLPRLMYMLSKEPVIESLVDEARGWLPEGFLSEENAATARRSLYAARSNYANLDSELAKTWIEALRGYRNINLAHSLLEVDQREKALFGYIEALLDVTLPVIKDLQLGVSRLDYDLDQKLREREKSADAFWSVVFEGMLLQQSQERRQQPGGEAAEGRKAT